VYNIIHTCVHITYSFVTHTGTYHIRVCIYVHTIKRVFLFRRVGRIVQRYRWTAAATLSVSFFGLFFFAPPLSRLTHLFSAKMSTVPYPRIILFVCIWKKKIKKERNDPQFGVASDVFLQRTESKKKFYNNLYYFFTWHIGKRAY